MKIIKIPQLKKKKEFKIWRALVKRNSIIYEICFKTQLKQNKWGVKNIRYTVLIKSKMILWGTKGQKNSNLYWQTDKTDLDKGLLHFLWSTVKEKNFSNCSSSSSALVSLSSGCCDQSLATAGPLSIPGNCSSQRGNERFFNAPCLLL